MRCAAVLRTLLFGLRAKTISEWTLRDFILPLARSLMARKMAARRCVVDRTWGTYQRGVGLWWLIDLLMRHPERRIRTRRSGLAAVFVGKRRS